jgi:hypothetical protein
VVGGRHTLLISALLTITLGAAVACRRAVGPPARNRVTSAPS